MPTAKICTFDSELVADFFHAVAAPASRKNRRSRAHNFFCDITCQRDPGQSLPVTAWARSRGRTRENTRTFEENVRMLVFGRENWPIQRTWCFTTAAGTAASVIVYLIFGLRSGSWTWPGGASPPGFVFGVLGGGIIIFEMLLWPRKSLLRGWRLGRTKLWMTAHIWLGLLTIPLLLLHGGFHFSLTTSTLAAVLMWLLVLVVSSGLFGLALQNFVPRLMLQEVPAETIYSQIGHVLEQYQAEADRLVELTCGRPLAAGGFRDDQPAQGAFPLYRRTFPRARCGRLAAFRERS